ncbi:hypothetical protein LJC64_02280 [Ruminococcaceae bacterium OttesenSCG-928-A11]|nr:hypothetical protein [Ruminococcaceae bacterium OttesenSCG-928-A11]
MAKSINFDTGADEYEVNGGRATLYFNPADPAVFAGILELQELANGFETRYAELEKKITGEMDEQGFPVGAEDVVKGMRELDADLKAQLRDVFGPRNDFDAIFDHMSCFAITENGDTIVNNFFEAITPLFDDGVNDRVAKMEKLKAIRDKAATNRAQRRAAAKGGRG